jgi:hypothetical protein
MDTSARKAARGALAGMAGTLLMSGVMLAAQKSGLLGKAPPHKINDRLWLWAAARWPRRSRRRVGSAASHFAFGTVGGALFGLGLRPGLRRAVRLPAGMAYGVAIWAGMYGVALPALGLMPRMARDRPGRPFAMALAHVVYGAVLALGV